MLRNLSYREPALMWVGIIAAVMDAMLATLAATGVMDAQTAAQVAATWTAALGAIGVAIRGSVVSPATHDREVEQAYLAGQD